MANLEGGLGIFAQQEIHVIPVLFNRWRDPVCDFGGLALEDVILKGGKTSSEGSFKRRRDSNRAGFHQEYRDNESCRERVDELAA
jgi:hypothetical protein